MRVPPLLLVASACVCGLIAGSSAQAPAPVAYEAQLNLVRYDLPRGLSDGYAPTRQNATRRDQEADAVDWPDFTLNGQPLFRSGPEEKVSLKLRKGGEAASPFSMTGDDRIEPGNHWLRAMEWRGGRRHIYTADKTARAANAAESNSGRYELWTFPLKIRTEGPPAVKNVVLKYDGATVYQRPGPWRSLTLLLPANEKGKQYELSVDGRPAIRFDIGLLPVKLGTPRDQLFAVSATLPGTPKIQVETLARPEEFPNQREWQADSAALAKAPVAEPAKPESPSGIARWLGVDDPRSGVLTYGMALPHGMSGGFFGKGGRAFEGDANAYAAHADRLRMDVIFDQANSLPRPEDAESLEKRAAAFAQKGIRLGLQYDNNWTRPSLQHPNVAFFAHTLAEWHAPLYRSLSLAAQRFAALPNFAGISIGADAAGYASYSYQAPPIPDRPWGEALMEFMGSTDPVVPRAPELGRPELPFEKTTAETVEFNRYVGRYDATFQQYGYLAEAVREVNPRLVFTTASFGSAPAAGARGGWPWASLPGRLMFEGVPVQQAYDSNNARSAKPLHLVALIDRLRSYQPKKRTWALLDNYQLLYGRESYQRAVALALTRGIQGLGTNFLPAESGENARPDAVGYVAEMNEWVHKYGGVFARTEPQPVIGIFYGHHQAVLRPVVGGENPPADKLYSGSHEGKVAEALFLCHAAGLPARVITYQELMREPLPDTMQALLFVGVDQADQSWSWSKGLEKPMGEFLARGGRILADDESVLPVKCERPGLKVAAYISQTQVDATPLLFARNQDNIAKLQATLGGKVSLPATSAAQDVWVIPAQCGDVQYVTVINQKVATGDEAQEFVRPADPRASKPEVWKTKGNASVYVPPQSATVKWQTDRPIINVRTGKMMNADSASAVDLTKHAFQWYALPPRVFSGLEVSVQAELKPGRNAFYEALVTTTKPDPIRGIPVKITVSNSQTEAVIYAATGWSVRLPLTLQDPGEWRITAEDLLTRAMVSTSLTIPAGRDVKPVIAEVAIPDLDAIERFAGRRHVALKVALTAQQAKDPAIAELAERLVKFYRERGRVASVGRAEPGGVVESLQLWKSPHRYPQWSTVPADLVLFGNEGNNVLIMDQARGYVLGGASAGSRGRSATLAYVRSAFVGEYDVLDILAQDAAGIRAGVDALISGTKEEVKLAR